MAEPICEQIAAAVFARLQAIDSDHFANLYVYRNHDAAHVEYPALVLFDGDMTPSSENSGFTNYDMLLRVDGLLNPADTSEIGRDINRLYAETLAALLEDTTLNGLAIDIIEGPRDVQIGRGEGQGPFGFFSLQFTVKFWTQEDDPYQVGP